MKTSTLTGADLNRAVAMALGHEVVRVPGVCSPPWSMIVEGRPVGIPDYAGNISAAWPLITANFICLDAGDGSFKGDKTWEAHLACDAPMMASEEITASDPLVAAMRALVRHVLGDDINLET